MKVISSLLSRYIAQFTRISPLCILIVAEMLRNTDDTLASQLKLLSFVLMLIISVIQSRWRCNQWLLLCSSVYVVVLVVSLLFSFNLQAGIEELIRFLFLPVILFYGYSLRHNAHSLFNFIIFVAFCSNLFQIYQYLNYFYGIGPTIYDLRSKDGGYFLNVGFFGISNAIVNLSAYVLVIIKENFRFKSLLSTFFFIFCFLTFSYKTIPFLFFAFFIFTKNKTSKIFVSVSFIALLSVFSPLFYDMYELLIRKIEVYVLVGNSARYESYRVMIEYLSEFNLFGAGLGSFGGPASVTYNSPLYAKYDFFWFKTTNLSTTDTFYPHLFVELGWVGGLLFFVIFFVPLLPSAGDARKINYFLAAALLFESLFSFGLLNLTELMCTAFLFYPMNSVYGANRCSILRKHNIRLT